MSNPDNQCGYCFEYHGKHKPECHAGTLGRIIFGSTQQNNRADTPNISKSSVCIECDLRQQRIAALEAQLAEVTAERDAANDDLSRVIIEREESRAETDRVMAWKRRRDGVVCGLKAERDTLRTALRQVAEAADKARIFLKNLTMRTGVDTRVGRDGYKEYERLRDALALQEVQGVLGRRLEGKDE